MEDQKLYEGLKYGVELFKYHADQRLRCIRYYIVIVLASVAGIFGLDRFLHCREVCQDVAAVIILFAISIIAGISLFFWLLDIRNRVLTEYAEKGLKKLEDSVFNDRTDEKDLKIINNSEDQKSAWHYGVIVPFFFFFMILTLVPISIGIALYSYSTPLCLVSKLLFVFIVFVFLCIGHYSEGKFLKANPTKNENPEVTRATRLRSFLFNYSRWKVVRSLGIVIIACGVLIFLGWFVLRSCPQ